ncbi:MAG TPA: mechanosensitive ion channel domain-containing protein [Longimicrobiaceae bacterium]|nr:mechanosensitive ion channel domain-containing protein [Longimicrobiaceae bacterium]
MIQLPLPGPTTPDSVSISVPFPAGFERWRDVYLDLGEKVVVFLVIALLLYLLTRFGGRLLRIHIEDVNRRHILRKWISYGYVVLLGLVAVALFADALVGLGTVLAVLLAGVAFALQDVLKSIVGWLYISGRSGVQVGSRVEVDGVVGDVIDIGVLKTTVLEIGNLVFGRQSTGRMVTIPNHKMLSENVHLSSAENPFVWQEVQILVTFESDWKRAEAILQEIGNDIYEDVAPDLEEGFRVLERRYAFKYGARTPIVYVTLGTKGVELALRFLIHVRRRRGSVDDVNRRVLIALENEPGVQLAYPTYRIRQAEEGVTEQR